MSQLATPEDQPIESDARYKDKLVRSKRKKILLIASLLVGLILLFMIDNWVRVLVALVVANIILVIGVFFLGAMARPVPDPPPPGELRKVKIVYRCPSCGTELRMTLANDEVPEPPRHCGDEMEFLKSGND